MSARRPDRGRTTTRRNVLVVSPDEAFRRAIRRELRDKAYNVRVTADPERTLPILADDPTIDAICYDTDNVFEWRHEVSRIRATDDQIGLVLVGTSRSFTEAITLRTDGYVPKRADRREKVDLDTLIEHLDDGIHRMDGTRARILGDPTILNGLCAGLFLAINGIRKNEGGGGRSEGLCHAAYDFADRIYRALPLDARQKVMLVDETTEGGVARVTFDLATLTDTGQPVQMLKRLRELRVKQVVADHHHFKDDKNMPLEGVYIGLTPPDPGEMPSRGQHREGYLLKEYIPGPNLTDLFLGMRRIAERRQDLHDGMKHLRDTCVDIALDRVHYWQEHAPAVDDERDPVRVAQFYEKQLPRAFETFLQYTTNVSLDPHTEMKFLRRTLAKAFDFRTLISLETIRRNLAATYRNMIFRTSTELPIGDSPSDATLEELVVSVLAAPVDRDALASRIVHVDTHRKYSHLLEDCLEVTDAYEAGLSPEERHGRLERVMAQHDTIRPQLEEALPIIGFYRSMRKIFFFVDRFGRQNDDAYMQGHITNRVHTERQEHYDQNIHHHLHVAKEWLNALLERETRYFDSNLRPAGLLALYSGMKSQDFWTRLEEDPRGVSEAYSDLLSRTRRHQDGSTEPMVNRLCTYIRLQYISHLLDRMEAYASIDYRKVER